MKRQRSIALAIAGFAAYLLAPAWALAQQPNAPGAADVAQSATHMSEELRGSVSKIVILATEGANSETVTGTYRNKTPGFWGGMAKGAEIGTIPVEVGGVPIGIPIPILRELGMIAGAISGKSKRELQEFRDRLTQDLKAAVDQPLTNDALANDVFWGLKNVPTLEPKILALTVPIPEDTEAVLFVALTDLSINVQDNVAIISTTATMRLDNAVDGTTMYRREITYTDQDTLSNWADDDTRLWREYRDFARHYIGREISAELYERVALRHELKPLETDTIKPVRKKAWQTESKSLNPTLAWNLELLGGDSYGAWVSQIDPAAITWDLEIYSANRPVYTARQLRGETHMVGTPLEACEVYRWSVRPTYVVEGVRKNGAWMRMPPPGATGNGNVGRAASTAHAYIQDFPSFKVNCRLKKR